MSKFDKVSVFALSQLDKKPLWQEILEKPGTTIFQDMQTGNLYQRKDFDPIFNKNFPPSSDNYCNEFHIRGTDEIVYIKFLREREVK